MNIFYLTKLIYQRYKAVKEEQKLIQSEKIAELEENKVEDKKEKVEQEVTANVEG